MMPESAMNMILRAEVKTATGKTRHTIGKLQEGVPVPMETLPVPHYVCIADEGSGFYLLHFNEEGQSFADTGHESLAAAKGQASFEFGISESDWKPL
jgi:hypothetical protein